MALKLKEKATSTRHYKFTAKSLLDAKATMDKRGPMTGRIRSHGACWVDWSFDGSRIGGPPPHDSENDASFKVAKVKYEAGTLNVQVYFIIPLWSNVESLSSAIKAEWARFLKCLWVHERGHQRDHLKNSAELFKELEALEVTELAGSAGGARAKAEAELTRQKNDILRIHKDSVREAIEAHDRKTQRGIAQGAYLNCGAVPPRSRGKG